MSFLSLSPDKNNKSNVCNLIEYISKTKYDNDWSSLPHHHNFTEIMLITDGQGTFINNEVFYPIKKGDLVVVPSGNMHTEKSNFSNNLSYYAIGMRNQIFMGVKDLVFSLDENYSSIFSLYSICFNELRSKQKDYEQVLYNILLSLFLLVQRVTFSTLKEVQKCGNAVIDKLIDYIDQNYNNELNLDTMCAYTYLSKPHLIRLFKEKTSLTPMEYVKNKRLSAAKVLLTTTELRIIDIAMMLNFPSESSFIAKFKNNTGITPFKYKRMSIH